MRKKIRGKGEEPEHRLSGMKQAWQRYLVRMTTLVMNLISAVISESPGTVRS